MTRSARPRSVPRDPAWAKHRVAAAYALIRGSECGELAVQQGWICQLFDFCRLRQRWPSEHEADQLRARAEAIKWDELPEAAGAAARARAERLAKEVRRV